jgi:hypothetical protein
MHSAGERRAKTLAVSFLSVIQAKIVFPHQKAFKASLFPDFLAFFASKMEPSLKAKSDDRSTIESTESDQTLHGRHPV